MNEILELRTPIDIIDPTLNDDVDSFPEKTRQAKEFLAKHGLPKAVQERYDKIIREKSFWIKGILIQVNAETNTFVVVGRTAGNLPNTHYTITALSSDVLTELVKSYWNDMVKVNIKPKTKRRHAKVVILNDLPCFFSSSFINT